MEKIEKLEKIEKIEKLEKEYNILVEKQKNEPAQVEDLLYVKEQLLQIYEEKIDYLSSWKDTPKNQMEAFDYDYDGLGSFRPTPIDRNVKKVEIYKRKIELVNSEEEI
jgi:hypothetical protein